MSRDLYTYNENIHEDFQINKIEDHKRALKKKI